MYGSNVTPGTRHAQGRHHGQPQGSEPDCAELHDEGNQRFMAGYGKKVCLIPVNVEREDCMVSAVLVRFLFYRVYAVQRVVLTRRICERDRFVDPRSRSVPLLSRGTHTYNTYINILDSVNMFAWVSDLLLPDVSTCRVRIIIIMIPYIVKLYSRAILSLS